MINLEIKTDPKVEVVFDKYPEHVKPKMLAMRKLVLESAGEIEEITRIVETLKWGEPSFLTKYGSTIRMDWKPKLPNQYALYFSCSTRLVETFRLLFRTTFQYEGKRAIIFQIDDNVPVKELKACIKAAMMYKKVKHLATLGI